MRTWWIAATGVVLALAVAMLWLVGTPSSTPSTPTRVEIGEALSIPPLFDLGGAAFDSADLAPSAERVEARIRAVLGPTVALDAPLRSIVADDDARRDVVERIVAPFGLVVGSESATSFATLGEVRDAVLRARSAPVVYVAWSPTCATCIALNDRMIATLVEGEVRAFALLVNADDDAARVARMRARKVFPLRLLVDSDFVFGTTLGIERTPHFVLVDAGGVVRYRGGLDNDLNDVLTGAERKDWLAAAIAAVRAGQPVAEPVTEPAGCSLRR